MSPRSYDGAALFSPGERWPAVTARIPKQLSVNHVQRSRSLAVWCKIKTGHQLAPVRRGATEIAAVQFRFRSGGTSFCWFFFRVRDRDLIRSVVMVLQFSGRNWSGGSGTHFWGAGSLTSKLVLVATHYKLRSRDKEVRIRYSQGNIKVMCITIKLMNV